MRCYCNEKKIFLMLNRVYQTLRICVHVCVCVCVHMPVYSDTYFLAHPAMVSQLPSHALLWNAGAGILQDHVVFTSW